MLFCLPSQSSFQLLHIFTSVADSRMKLIFAAESYVLQIVYSKARPVWIPEWHAYEEAHSALKK